MKEKNIEAAVNLLRISDQIKTQEERINLALTGDKDDFGFEINTYGGGKKGKDLIQVALDLLGMPPGDSDLEDECYEVALGYNNLYKKESVEKRVNTIISLIEGREE